MKAPVAMHPADANKRISQTQASFHQASGRLRHSFVYLRPPYDRPSTPRTLPSSTTLPLTVSSPMPVAAPEPSFSHLCNRSLLSFGLMPWFAVPTVTCAIGLTVSNISSSVVVPASPSIWSVEEPLRRTTKHMIRSSQIRRSINTPHLPNSGSPAPPLSDVV